MAVDTTTSLLQLLIMGDGLHENDWGDQTSLNLERLESAICGAAQIDISAGGTITLTADQVRPYFLTFVGTPGANVTVIVPASTKQWRVTNSVTGGYAVNLKTSGLNANVFSFPGNSAATISIIDGINVVSTGDALLGEIKEYAGIELPSASYTWANGAPLARASYVSLYNTITRTTLVTASNGSNSLTVTEDLTAKGLIGAPIEGPNIPAGATITAVTMGTLTMSTNTTAAITSVTVRMFPWGNGDGVNTFNVPDTRQRLGVPRGDMGGATDPGRITTFSISVVLGLGRSSGTEGWILTTDQLPAHTHTVNDPTHSHTISQSAHAHNVNLPGPGFWFVPGGGGDDTYNTNLNNTRGSTASFANVTNVASGTGISLANTGSGNSHPNMPPFYNTNKICRVL